MAKHKNDGERISHSETTWFDGTVQKPASPSLGDRPTMKPRATDGVNAKIPDTAATRAPGQFGRS